MIMRHYKLIDLKNNANKTSMKNYFFLFLFSLLLINCKTKEPKKTGEKNTIENPSKEGDLNGKTKAALIEEKPEKIQPIFKESIKMGKVDFDVYAENSEMTKINVTCNDLSIRKYKKEFEVEGQLKNTYSLDLNKDGFYELYMVVQQTDDSGNHDIIGIASFNDKSAGEIYVKDVKTIRVTNSDKVYEKDGQLMREFLDKKNNMQMYKYQLKKGEAGFILRAVKI